MNRRTIILIAILAVLIPIAIYMNLRAFRSPRPVGPRVIPAPKTTVVPPPSPAEEAAPEGVATVEPEGRPFVPVVVDRARFSRLVASGKWGREPFLTAEEVQRMSQRVVEAPVEAKEKKEAAPVARPTPTVSSVLLSDEEKVAIINGEFYTVGDIIPATGERVVAITPDGVLLEAADDRRLITITLEQSKIRLKTRER